MSKLHAIIFRAHDINHVYLIKITKRYTPKNASFTESPVVLKTGKEASSN
jgi:hypothetical protein